MVLNAGIARDNAFPALEDSEWDSVLDTDLGGFYNVLRPIVMPMVSARHGGRIVTISSVSGLMGNRGQVNYSAAKAGIIGATKALAIELAKRNITVNCVAPGLIETQMLEGVPLDEVLKTIPMRRVGRPDEVAAAGEFSLLRRGELHHASGDIGQRRNGMRRRVVVTGMGGITALGEDWPTIRARFEAGKTGVRRMPEWDRYRTLNTRLAAPIDGFDVSSRYDRKKLRTMGPVVAHGGLRDASARSRTQD